MAFQRFTRAALEAAYQAHPLPQAGRDYIERALAAPSRNVQGSARNEISDIPDPKMWFSAQSEAITTENPATLQNVFDPDVIGFINQPPSLDLVYKGRNSRTVRTPYTPDVVLAHRKHGWLLDEWKAAEDRDKLEEKYPGRYRRLPHGAYVSDPIEKAVAPLGLKFTVRFSDEIPNTATLNRRYLYTYLEPRAALRHEPNLPRLFTLFKGRSAWTHLELVADQKIDADDLNWAIAHGHLHIEFASASIANNAGSVLVFRDQVALLAYREVAHAGLLLPGDDGFNYSDLLPNSDIVFDGRKIHVDIVGSTGLHGRDESGRPVYLENSVLVEAKRRHQLVLPNPPDPLIQQRSRRFWTLDNGSFQRALHRLAILDALEKGAEPPGTHRFSSSTIRLWRRLCDRALASGRTPLEALIDDVPDRGFHGSHIPIDQSAHLDRRIEELLGQPVRQSKLLMYGTIEDEFKAKGWTMVAKSSFYERAKKIESVKTLRASQGDKVAYQVEPVYWQLHLDTPVHCERAFELVHFDSTLLDIELCSSISGEVLGRPWLSLAMCARARRVLAFYLSFFPPSYVSSMMLLADIIRRHGRIPDAIIHDWGGEFRKKEFKDALTALFITRHVRPKHAARFGSVLERMFGVTTTEFIHNLFGNTKARKNVRLMSLQMDPSRFAGLTQADLYEGLETYFTEYDNRKHPGILVPPRLASDQLRIGEGLRLHRMRSLEEVLPVLSPLARGGTRTVDSSRGVYENYSYYGHPALQHLHMDGSKVSVKPVLFDPGLVLAFVNGNWVKCKSSLWQELQGVPEYVRRSMYEELILEHRAAQKEKDGSRRDVRRIIDQLNAKALANVAYWKDAETRGIYRELGSPVIPSPATRESANDGSMQALEEKFRAAIAQVRAAAVA